MLRADTREAMKDPWSKSHKWAPMGRIPVGHLFVEGATGIWKSGLSRNHRLVERISDPEGNLHVWRIRGSKDKKANRLPRGFRRHTGLFHGKNVADMVRAA